MQIGVFIPIGNNGWLISTTSPQYSPSFALNREVVQRAERYGFDFALSMIKLRGFGGPSGHWNENLESFTLMSALAAVTSRIELYATVPVLAIPPAIAARMAVTIDDVSGGRFGLNLITGWQRAEYAQMGLWPGDAHYAQRYDMLTEYVEVMQSLWNTGRCDLQGRFYTMEDCRLAPQPSRPIPLIAAGTSEPGMAFAARHCTYNFCTGSGAINDPRDSAGNVAKLRAAAEAAGSPTRALALTMVIADETDEAAMAKWRHYKAGTDLEAIAWRSEQASGDKAAAPNSHSFHLRQSEPLPNAGSKLIGSYATVARLLDEMAEVEGLAGVMLTFDDFIIGIEQFGQRIQPLMRSRARAAALAAALAAA
ncbi:pyrimidine oxygenase [Belnapia rosea]|uniref:Pyrimidine monooxygenase RutA n=2 Tax=Belnapia rosea TaxID=938405 RepID=A0A1G6UCB4_9PROT|nr:pyrimidine oxygenase [Belnapia rosea]SDD38874.1 pyrimidine oxygenase [Belnapia rosea]